MTDVEVHIDLDGATQPVGLLRKHLSRRDETVTFEYDESWLVNDQRFSIEPALTLTRGVFPPLKNQAIFGAIGDSAPDTWGRRLMQRAERRSAIQQTRHARALGELDYLLGASDETRLGALRFRWHGDNFFQAPSRSGVPAMIELGRLLQITERVLRDEETDEDLQLIFAPGSSLGGARPKASIIDQHGRLSIAKFPKETDDYSVEAWESIAFDLARRAGIVTPEHQMVDVGGKQVLISRRFDRVGSRRIPFLSAMSMTGLSDGERGSYPEIVDAMTRYGARAKADAEQLYRRVVFNVLISNVDDHLRNHGFLWQGKSGWILSPAYDLNPTPTDIKARVLSTNINLDEASCSLDLLQSAAEYFGLTLEKARMTIREVAQVTTTWESVAKAAKRKKAEIARMASAFEHQQLSNAQRLGQIYFGAPSMSERSLLPDVDSQPESKHRIFLAALPDAEAIVQLRKRTELLKVQYDLKRSPVIDQRLHVSLIDLGDHPDLPPSLLESISRAAAAVSLPAFDVVFDQAELFPRAGALFLKESVRSEGFSTLKKSLATLLRAEGVRYKQSPAPHITLLYDRKAISRQPVEPVAWTLKEFVLVHSEIGKASRPYDILGRWPLQT